MPCIQLSYPPRVQTSLCIKGRTGWGDLKLARNYLSRVHVDVGSGRDEYPCGASVASGRGSSRNTSADGPFKPIIESFFDRAARLARFPPIARRGRTPVSLNGTRDLEAYRWWKTMFRLRIVRRRAGDIYTFHSNVARLEKRNLFVGIDWFLNGQSYTRGTGE